MATPENSFIAGVHGYVQCYKMKNHNEYVSGIADCWYSGSGSDLWIEYKFVVVPKRDTTIIVPELSKLQLEWLTDRHAEGRNVLVVIGCKAGACIYRDPSSWVGGKNAADFRRELLSRRQLAEQIDLFVNQ